MAIPVLDKVPPSPETAVYGLKAKAEDVIDPIPPMLTETVPGPEPNYRLGPHNDAVHEVASGEVIQVAQSLAEAFEDDPHFSYMLRNEDKRLQRLGHGILSFIEHDWLPNGVVNTNDQLSGAAAWLDPGKWQASITAQARILRSLTGVVTLAEIAKLSYVLGFVEGKHKEIEDKLGPHMYLAMLGVTPEWQSRGWGDALMRPTLEKCDNEGIPAYLEASTPRNVPLYERNGFRVIAKGQYRGATEQLHFMWRQPRNP